jgi:methanogenic corrinoid protein MtbC1
MTTPERTLERILPPLLAGQRQICRDVLSEVLQSGMRPEHVYQQVMWPAMEQVARMYRADQINLATEHMATRISRSLVDQLQARLPRGETNGKSVLLTCADGEPEELGAQMCADLFESAGWTVYFVGGGVPSDEILSLVGQYRPTILLIFGTQPAGVPGVRRLIDLIREVNPNPSMNIMISGGVFNRADELWKEVNADLFAKSAAEALEVAGTAKPREPQVRVAGAPKKRRRRRRSPLLQQAEA